MVSRVRAAAREAKRPIPARPGPIGPVWPTVDGIANAVARLGIGTGNNQASAATYNFNPITRNRIVLDWAYRGSWIARAAVDCIAEDMTRDGVELGSELDPEQKADLLAACTDEYPVWDELCDTLQWARLYGGALLYMMIKGQRPDTPFDPSTVGKGGLEGLIVLDRWMVNPSLNDLVTDPRSPDVGRPKYYDVVADAPVAARTKIHHSRVIRLEGDKIPYWQKLAENFWGLSVLEPVWDRMLAFDSTSQGVAQLVYKAHLRVLSVEGLRALLGGRDQVALEGFHGQVAMMREFMSNEGFSVIDAKDRYEAHQYAFGGLSDIILQFGEQVSGALQIPLVRLFGQAPAGLNATGDSDWENYESGIKRRWKRTLRTPLVRTLLPVVARSVGIRVPEAFTANLPPLRQLSYLDKLAVAEGTERMVADALDRGVITSRATALKELRTVAEVTGHWTSITDEDVDEAEHEPPPLIGEPGEADDPFLPHGANDLPPEPVEGHSRRSFLPGGPRHEDETDDEDPDAPPPKRRPFLPGRPNDYHGVPNVPNVHMRPHVERVHVPNRRLRMRDALSRAAAVGTALGLPVVVETPAGTPRWNGKIAPGDYGYFEDTLGLDGDAVDVMVGFVTDGWDGYVIEKRKPDGDLEQHKVFVGYATAEDAANAFRLTWGSRPLGTIQTLSIVDLHRWLEDRRPTVQRIRAVT